MNNVFSIKVNGSVSHINLDGPDPLTEFEAIIAGQDEYRVVGFPLADELGLQWESYTAFHQAQNMVYHLQANGPLAMLLYLRKCRAAGMVTGGVAVWHLLAGKFTGVWDDIETASADHLNYFLSRIVNLSARSAVRECLDWRKLAEKAQSMGVFWFFERQDVGQEEFNIPPSRTPDLSVPPVIAFHGVIPPIIREMEIRFAKQYPERRVVTYYPLTTLFTGNF